MLSEEKEIAQYKANLEEEEKETGGDGEEEEEEDKEWDENHSSTGLPVYSSEISSTGNMVVKHIVL